MLTLGFGAVSLYDIVVIVGTLEGRLHTSQLVLYSVKLYTGLLARLSDFADGLFSLSQFEIDTFVLVGQLFGERVLQARHERLYSTDTAGSVTIWKGTFQISLSKNQTCSPMVVSERAERVTYMIGGKESLAAIVEVLIDVVFGTFWCCEIWTW